MIVYFNINYFKKLTIVLSIATYWSLNLKSQNNSHTDFQLNHSSANEKQYDKVCFYFGAGITVPSEKLKVNTYINNTFNLSFDYYLPIAIKKKFSFGWYMGLEIFYSHKIQLVSAYNVVGQQAQPVVDVNANSIKLSGINWGFGPQFNLPLGDHFILSPILKMGLLKMEYDDFAIFQTSTVNGKFNSTDLVKQTETIIEGGCFSSKLRLHYYFNNLIGLWTEVNYLRGPTVTNSFVKFTPNGNPDQNGYYTASQMSSGSYTNLVNQTVYSSVGLNFGIVFLPKEKQRK